MYVRNLLEYGAASATFMAGILHLTLVANAIDRNFNTGILFLVGGLAQIFWVVPVIKKWGKKWYYVGISGTLIFIILWVITRMPGNPITERGGSINGTGIAVEIFQLAFIILSMIILVKDRFRSTTQDRKEIR